MEIKTMSKTAYLEADPDDLWTKNGRQFYEAGLYDSMVEKTFNLVKQKPGNKAYYEKLKEQMIEYLYYAYLERKKQPLDTWAKIVKYGKLVRGLYPDTDKIKWWQRYLDTAKFFISGNEVPKGEVDELWEKMVREAKASLGLA